MISAGRRKKACIKGLCVGLLFGLLVVMLCGALPVSASSGHEGEAKGWVITDTYKVICFAVLVVVLYAVLRKPMSQAFQGRIQGIKDELMELEARKKEAEAKLAEYNERLSRLDEESKKIVDGYIQQGKEAHTRILTAARASAEKLEAGARRHIESAFDRARVEVQETIIEKAMEKAEAAIRANISADDQNRLLDDYLEKVAAS